MEEQAVQTKEEYEAREKVQIEMAKWAKAIEAPGDVEIRDVAPHLVGRG